MDKENQADKYVSIYEISGTIYEVEKAFSGTETLNNKIIRLMLSEKIQSKGADNPEKAHYNDSTHSVLSGGKTVIVKDMSRLGRDYVKVGYFFGNLFSR